MISGEGGCTFCLLVFILLIANGNILSISTFRHFKIPLITISIKQKNYCFYIYEFRKNVLNKEVLKRPWIASTKVTSTA